MNDPTPSFVCKPALTVVKNKVDWKSRLKTWCDSNKPDACFQGGKEGHYKRDYTSEGKRDFTFAIADGMDFKSHWKLDSGLSRHSLTMEGQLHDAEESMKSACSRTERACGCNLRKALSSCLALKGKFIKSSYVKYTTHRASRGILCVREFEELGYELF